MTVGFLALHSWMKPYDSQLMNRLEMGALVCAALTLFVAQLLVAEATSGVVVAMVVIVVANVLLLVWAAWIIVHTAAKKGVHNWCLQVCGARGGMQRRDCSARRLCPWFLCCCSEPSGLTQTRRFRVQQASQSETDPERVTCQNPLQFKENHDRQVVGIVSQSSSASSRRSNTLFAPE